MVAAGIGAIIAAVVKAYRTALGMLIVAIGVIIFRFLVLLFFEAGNSDYR
jgi:hypothetical protein